MSDTIYVLMEGDRDLDYYETLIEPILNNKYDQVIPYKYIQKKKEKVNKYIKVIKKIKADYYVLTDMDESESVEDAIQKILNRMDNLIDKNNVIVVIKEIECWYIAGMPQSFIERYDINLDISNTEIYEKEDFDCIIPTNMSHVIFYTRILELYDCNNAIKRNNSLKFFYDLIK